MTRRISPEPHLTIEDHEGRQRSTKDPVERSCWHFLWLLARGLMATGSASNTTYSAYWIDRITRRYKVRIDRPPAPMRLGRLLTEIGQKAPGFHRGMNGPLPISMPGWLYCW